MGTRKPDDPIEATQLDAAWTDADAGDDDQTRVDAPAFPVERFDDETVKKDASELVDEMESRIARRVPPPRPNLPSELPVQQLTAGGLLPGLPRAEPRPRQPTRPFPPLMRPDVERTEPIGPPLVALPAPIPILEKDAEFVEQVPLAIAMAPSPADAVAPSSAADGVAHAADAVAPSPAVDVVAPTASAMAPDPAAVPTAAAPPAPEAPATWVEAPAFSPPTQVDPTFSRPVAMPIVAGIAVAAGLLGVLFGFVGGRLTAPRVAAVASARTDTVTTPASAAAAPSSLLDRAELGDEAAIVELERRPAPTRSVTENLSLALGRDARERIRLDALAAKLRADPGLLARPERRAELWRFAEDGRTTSHALALIAELPGSFGPDLLFHIWTGTAERTPSTELAAALVHQREVRAKASPALELALALREAESCEVAQALLPKAAEVADRRALRPLVLMAAKTGCGPGKQSDCYPCLRADPDALDAALKGAESRPAPRVP